MSIVEKVARAMYDSTPFKDSEGSFDEQSATYKRGAYCLAVAAIEAIPDDDEAFLAALSERVHDARFSKSGETYPVLRNFIRALKDAALNECTLDRARALSELAEMDADLIADKEGE